jgi:NO-binding membrane sensor protein with MHYT domain
MHHVGVSGMMMRASMSFNYGVVFASVLIAIATSGTDLCSHLQHLCLELI